MDLGIRVEKGFGMRASDGLVWDEGSGWFSIGSCV